MEYKHENHDKMDAQSARSEHVDRTHHTDDNVDSDQHKTTALKDLPKRRKHHFQPVVTNVERRRHHRK